MPFPSLPLPPAPRRLVPAIAPRMPVALQRPLVESLLNRTFAESLAEGEFDALAGRRVSLVIADLGLILTLSLSERRLVRCEAPGEATLRGGWREFLSLATRREDPDSLFFQRRLSLEGDTELGLMVNNLLDGREEGMAQGRLGDWLVRLERLARRDH
ncbi:ubiquinone anaerobic biosynthesis accessory factor UbiT [Halomonas stenophila]|uniref:Ubiquinone biosynthesis accessory factor UbiT n=1 Tax=Halomonas stenophila TaxID=795312 RepID=A0A7W5HL28_9GAMM|nr:SCP2 sterol-binding domain-containing protein [Halomonas stenophila]MBB3230709.1 putative lipid carrier protein YhbT [Halomonas stenophila]